MARYIDFKKVREQIDMEDLLSQYQLLPSLTHTKTGWQGSCPFTQKQSKQKPFKADTDKNLWKCFCSDCKAAGRKGGNTLDFIMAMEGCNIRQAAEKAVTWFNLDTSSKQKNQKSVNKQKAVVDIGREEVTENKPLTFKLKGLQADHPYFKKVGLLDSAVIEYFGLGYYPGKGMMRGRVVIPLHNPKGELVAYLGRDPEERKPDLYPKDFNSTLEIYNLNRVIAKGQVPENEVNIFFDFLPLWFFYTEAYSPMLVFPNAKISARQIELLEEAFEGTTTFLISRDEVVAEEKQSEFVYTLAKHFLVRVL